MTEQKQTEGLDHEASDACGCNCDCGDFSRMAEMMSRFRGAKKGGIDFRGMMAKMKDCFAEKSE
jgi:hypothetical protein